MKTYNITPIAAPRMTRSDKWRKKNHPNPKWEIRACVEKYWNFKDKVKELGINVENRNHVSFYIPMPKSWNDKKKERINGKPHEQRPDVDNLTKALLDSIFKEDSHIYDIRISKHWSYEGKITIEEY